MCAMGREITADSRRKRESKCKYFWIPSAPNAGHCSAEQELWLVTYLFDSVKAVLTSPNVYLM